MRRIGGCGLEAGGGSNASDVRREPRRDHRKRNVGGKPVAEQAFGILVPAGDPVLRVGVEHRDTEAEAGKLGGKQQHGGCLAGAALGVGEGDDGHEAPRRVGEPVIARKETPCMVRLHPRQSWLTAGENA